MTIETLDMHGAERVTEERIIRGHGRPRAWTTASPTTLPQIGEEVFRVEDWTVYHPQDVRAASWSTMPTSPFVAGEIVGHRRASWAPVAPSSR
ncbi:MAG: hypothetical protein V9F04_13375 [Dermatophilaceae bacterium]